MSRWPRSMVLAALVAATVQAVSFAAAGQASVSLGAIMLPTTPMLLPRAGNTATELLDGSVLVTGGTGAVQTSLLPPGSTIATSPPLAERYLPTTRTWVPAGIMHLGRWGAEAVRLHDGRVLVAGGVDGEGNWTQAAEVYDPRTNAWTLTAPLPSTVWVQSPVFGQTVGAALLGDGRVLVAGLASPFAPAPLVTWSPTSGTWSGPYAGASTIDGSSLTALPDGDVLIAGGFPGIHQNIAAFASIFHAATNSVTATGSMTIGRAGHSAVLLRDGRVLVAGGQTSLSWITFTIVASAELYDPATGTWSATAPMHESRAGAGAALVPGTDDVLVVGGEALVSAAELYDATAGRWSSAGRLAAPAACPTVAAMGPTASTLHHGSVLAAGGNPAGGCGIGSLLPSLILPPQAPPPPQVIFVPSSQASELAIL